MKAPVSNLNYSERADQAVCYRLKTSLENRNAVHLARTFTLLSNPRVIRGTIPQGIPDHTVGFAG